MSVRGESRELVIKPARITNAKSIIREGRVAFIKCKVNEAVVGGLIWRIPVCSIEREAVGRDQYGGRGSMMERLAPKNL